MIEFLNAKPSENMSLSNDLIGKKFLDCNFTQSPDKKYQFQSATELLHFALIQCKFEWVCPVQLLKSIQEEINEIYFDFDYNQFLKQGDTDSVIPADKIKESQKLTYTQG